MMYILKNILAHEQQSPPQLITWFLGQRMPHWPNSKCVKICECLVHNFSTTKMKRSRHNTHKLFPLAAKVLKRNDWDLNGKQSLNSIVLICIH